MLSYVIGINNNNQLFLLIKLDSSSTIRSSGGYKSQRLQKQVLFLQIGVPLLPQLILQSATVWHGIAA